MNKLIIYYLLTIVVGLTLDNDKRDLSSSEPWYYGLFGHGRSTLNFQTQITNSDSISSIQSATQSLTNDVEPSQSSILDSILTQASSVITSASAIAQSTQQSNINIIPIPTITTRASSRSSLSSSSITTSSSSVSSSSFSSEWYQPFIPNFLTNFQSSTISSSNYSNSSLSNGDASKTEGVTDSTDETESNSDGNGKRNPYTPYNVTCPKQVVRQASGISDNEKNYIESRYEITNDNLIKFLDKANISNFNAKSFINDYSNQHNITIGLAYSGGGWRSTLCGAGQLLALDDRHSQSKDLLGGLLQSSTYLVGLSGGSWLVGSLVLNDWMSIDEILDDNSGVWQIENSVFNPAGIDLTSNIEYYYALAKAVMEKQNAGFETSLTDIWGRALSHQFFNDTSGGSNITWSSIRDMENFKNHTMPYPIILTNGKYPDTLIVNANSTIFEVSPYEFGSWDKSLNSFSDTKYIGSNLNNGHGSGGSCIENYDNAGFLLGTSSSVFNEALLTLNQIDVNSIIKLILTNALGELSNSKDDVAIYPNTFYNVSESNSQSLTSNSSLYLVDGGEDGENIPFYPLIQNDRQTDIIFGFDNSADTKENWPNGTSIIETYKRQFSDQGKGTPFPFVPDIDTFLNNNLTNKPIFFGCEAKNLTNLVKWHNNENINETNIPLIVYIANTKKSYDSNFSTFKLNYDNDEKMGTIQNGFDTMTRNNLTDDENWLTCVGCAIIRRQQERLGIEQSDECKLCFKEYCWTGGFDDAVKVNVSLDSKTHQNSTRYQNSTSTHHNNTKTSSSSKLSTTSINFVPITSSSSDKTTVDAQSQSTSSVNNSAGINFYLTYNQGSRSTIQPSSYNSAASPANQGESNNKISFEMMIFNLITGILIFI